MLLDVKDLFVSYDKFQALHGISLNINEGEIVALLGSNGAGKTTTIKTVSGLLTPSSGKIEYKGQDISTMPTYKRVEEGIIQVPEGRRLFPYLTVEDNLIAGSYSKRSRVCRKESLEFCYETFPKLYERRRQLAGSLSGGEQQMCAIARALMSKPEIMMMDEPSLGLAPIIVEGIFETIKNLNKQGMTILLVEQNVASSLEIADRAFVIESGENTISGTGAELRNNEQLQKAYLGID